MRQVTGVERRTRPVRSLMSMVWAVFGPQTLGDRIYNERASKCLDVTGLLQDRAGVRRSVVRGCG
jgi:hypothetical protein